MKLVSRSGWGANSPVAKPITLSPQRIDTLVVHYSGADADEANIHENCYGRVRGIQNYHQKTKGWNDIAYNFLVCKHGYVFEGRGWDVMSAATFGHNDHTQAVCFLGNDNVGRDDTTNLGRQAIAEVAHTFQHRYKRYKTGGHRDFVSTECPGDELYAFINSKAFTDLVNFDNKKRLAALRKWILARKQQDNWSWKRIKQSPNWREFIRRGGK